jgi:hypothetical protein
VLPLATILLHICSPAQNLKKAFLWAVKCGNVNFVWPPVHKKFCLRPVRRFYRSGKVCRIFLNTSLDDVKIRYIESNINEWRLYPQALKSSPTREYKDVPTFTPTGRWCRHPNFKKKEFRCRQKPKNGHANVWGLFKLNFKATYNIRPPKQDHEKNMVLCKKRWRHYPHLAVRYLSGVSVFFGNTDWS